jgi:hypothetical protein
VFTPHFAVVIEVMQQLVAENEVKHFTAPASLELRQSIIRLPTFL